MAEKKRWFLRPSRTIPLAALALGLVAAIVWVSSPWPAALLIRAMFEKGAQDTVDEMLPYVGDEPLDEQLDVEYGSGQKLDVFSPEGTTAPLPTVIWIHGGAWISGAKENVNPYARILSQRGFTTVTLDYSISPEVTYPTAIGQVNDAIAFLVANAAQYNIDPNRIVVAGDSAGANLASQFATIVTSPKYASGLGIEPALSKEQLRGVVLNCGIYDVSGIPNAPGIGGWGFRIALWAYLGEKDWSEADASTEMSTLDFVNYEFPDTWISGGNADPLTESQSMRLVDRLNELDVPVTPVFYDAAYEPELPHEYQFHLDFDAARAALESTVEFLKSVTT